MKDYLQSAFPVKRLCLFFVVDFIAYLIGRTFQISTVDGIPIFWPAPGVYLGFLLCARRHEWIGLSLVTFGVRLFGNILVPHGHSFMFQFSLWLSSLLTYAGGAELLKKSMKKEPVDSVRFWVLILLGGGVALPMVASLLSTAAADFWGIQRFSIETWRFHLAGKSLGVWVATPLVLNLLYESKANTEPFSWYERVVDFGSVIISIAMAALIFHSQWLPLELRIPIVIMPLLLWVALRGKLLLITVTNSVIALLAIVATAQAAGPFSQIFSDPVSLLTALQVFLGIIILTSILACALVSSRANALSELKAQSKKLVQINDELQRTSESFDQLIEQASDGIFIVDQNFNIQKVNLAACEMTGYSRDVLAKMHITEIAIPSINGDFTERDQTALKNGESILSEVWHRRADGSLFLAEVSAKQISDGRIQGIVRDITKRKAMEDQLRRSDAQFRTLIENSPQIIFKTDRNGDAEFISKSWLSYTGLAGKSLWERNLAIHPDDLHEVKIKTQAAARSRSLFECEYRLRDAQGNYRWFLNRSLPIVDDRGQISNWIGFSVDIHDQKQISEVILERSQFSESQRLRLETILNTIPTPVAIVEIESGNTVFANPSAHRITAESQSKTFPNKLLAKGEQFDDLELEWQSTAGNFVLLFSGRPLPETPGEAKTCVLSFRDITFLRDMENQLRNANRELEMFASMASHDLQEPLRTISSYLQLILMRHKGKLGVESEEFIHFIVDASARMRTLVSELLNYARAGQATTRPSVVDCNRIAEQAIRDIKVLVEEKRAAITFSNLPSLVGRENDLQFLLQNLICNGIRYNRSPNPWVRISSKKTTEGWEFSVCDNGIGIEAQNHQRIFEAFQRVESRSEFPGTGLGLAVCKRIVEAHGGRLWVESALGRGSTFHFTVSSILPVLAAKPTAWQLPHPAVSF